MKKNTGKVLSLVLALAMIVTSFSATFSVSAASASKESGGRLGTDAVDEFYVTSQEDKVGIIIDDLDNYITELYSLDREEGYDIEFVSFNHASGSKLVTVTDKYNDDDIKQLVLKKNASGTETISLTYRASLDRDDRTITVTGKYDVDITAVKEGEYALGAAGQENSDEIDEIDDWAVNEVVDSGIAGVTKGFSLYKVSEVADTAEDYSEYATIVTSYENADAEIVTEDTKIASDKYFELDADAQTITSKIINEDKGLNGVGSTTLTVKYDDGKKKLSQKISVVKEWIAVEGAEIQRKLSNTYITKIAGADFDDDDEGGDFHSSNRNTYFQIVTGYDIVMNGSLDITSGTVKKVTGTGALNIEDGNVGDVDLSGTGDSLTMEDGSVGAIIDVDDVTLNGGKASSINESDAVVTINPSASVSGDVTAADITVSSDDDDAATIGGDVKVYGALNVDAGEKAASINGKVTVCSDDNGPETTATILIEGQNADVANIDVDYLAVPVTFSDYKGTIDTFENAKNVELTLESEAQVEFAGAVDATSVYVDTDTKATFAEAEFDTIDGEGTVAVPAGKLFVGSSISGTMIQLVGDFAAGAEILRCYTNAVDVDDFVGVGYEAEVQAVNEDIDVLVVKTVKFAGASFTKTSVEIAKVYSESITANAYPTGTSLPEGASIELVFEAAGNEDNFEVTRDGNVVTITALDWNADYDTDNLGTLTATIVDEDGYALEDYIVATCSVKIIEKPAAIGVLRADTTEYTMAPGGIYDILFTVTGTDLVPTVTDSRTGSVVTLTNLSGNKYRVTGVNAGTTYIQATVNGVRVSVKVNVVEGATASGVKGDNYANIPAVAVQ